VKTMLIHRRSLLAPLGAGLVQALHASPGRAADLLSNRALPIDPDDKKPTAKHVIFIVLRGGLSHIDSFDPKPELEKQAGKALPRAFRTTFPNYNGNILPSPWKFTKQGQSGIEVSTLFPEIGRQIDDFCVIRSMTTDRCANDAGTTHNHDASLRVVGTGHGDASHPSLGAWMTWRMGTGNPNLPPHVVLAAGDGTAGSAAWGSGPLPAIFAGTHVVPKLLTRLRSEKSPGASELSQLRTQLDRHHNRTSGEWEFLEARTQAAELAARVSQHAREFSTAKNGAGRARIYGDSFMGQSCRLAHDLVAAGTRFVEIQDSGEDGNGLPWDCHGDLRSIEKHARNTDQAIASLVREMKANGLLRDTMICVTTEFGRNPVATSEQPNGRGHHHHAYCTLLAGAATKVGTVFGKTDDFGLTPIENAMHIRDLHASLWRMFGYRETAGAQITVRGTVMRTIEPGTRVIDEVRL